MADPLPGAPPADDAAAWAPYQSPGGLTPDQVPFTPAAVDMAKLTPMQKHEFKQVIAGGDRAAYEAFAASISDRGRSSEMNAASLNAGSPGTPPSPDGEPAPPVEEAPGVEPDASPLRRSMAEKLTEFGSSIEMIDTLEQPVAKFHERLSAISDEQLHAAVLEGEQQVIDRLFAGSEGRFKAALDDIRTAALAVGGDALVKEIDDSAVLTDPGLFQRIWLLAKSVNPGAKS